MPKVFFEKEPFFNSFKLTYLHELMCKALLYIHCYLQLHYNVHFRNYTIKNKPYVLNFICEKWYECFSEEDALLVK